MDESGEIINKIAKKVYQSIPEAFDRLQMKVIFEPKMAVECRYWIGVDGQIIEKKLAVATIESELKLELIELGKMSKYKVAVLEIESDGTFRLSGGVQ